MTMKKLINIPNFQEVTTVRKDGNFDFPYLYVPD